MSLFSNRQEKLLIRFEASNHCQTTISKNFNHFCISPFRGPEKHSESQASYREKEEKERKRRSRVLSRDSGAEREVDREWRIARIERAAAWRRAQVPSSANVFFPVGSNTLSLDKVPNLGTAKPANYVTYVGARWRYTHARTHDAHGPRARSRIVVGTRAAIEKRRIARNARRNSTPACWCV